MLLYISTFRLAQLLNFQQSNNAFSVDADVVHVFRQQFSSQFNRKHAFPFFDLFRAIPAVQFVCLELSELGTAIISISPRFRRFEQAGLAAVTDETFESICDQAPVNFESSFNNSQQWTQSVV